MTDCLRFRTLYSLWTVTQEAQGPGTTKQEGGREAESRTYDSVTTRFVCCDQNGCNWSLDNALNNLAVTDSWLLTVLPTLLGTRHPDQTPASNIFTNWALFPPAPDKAKTCRFVLQVFFLHFYLWSYSWLAAAVASVVESVRLEVVARRLEMSLPKWTESKGEISSLARLLLCSGLSLLWGSICGKAGQKESVTMYLFCGFLRSLKLRGGFRQMQCNLLRCITLTCNALPMKCIVTMLQPVLQEIFSCRIWHQYKWKVHRGRRRSQASPPQVRGPGQPSYGHTTCHDAPRSRHQSSGVFVCISLIVSFSISEPGHHLTPWLRYATWRGLGTPGGGGGGELEADGQNCPHNIRYQRRTPTPTLEPTDTWGPRTD